ncbi:EF-hand domain-containing protein [Peristeroidobacter soli]|uniref:hypothetical protein n=1 Tax=Peristeroidobacter soli TaxID=2497877 RepID=UPI001300A7CB|nr:hypothetical protein [Peristeroidobacter soli]
MQKLLFAVAGSACLLTATGASADDQKKIATAPAFATLDRNGDHRLSRSEAGFDRWLSDTFAELDTDGDGFVSMAEFNAARDKDRVTVGKLTRQ